MEISPLISLHPSAKDLFESMNFSKNFDQVVSSKARAFIAPFEMFVHKILVENYAFISKSRGK